MAGADETIGRANVQITGTTDQLKVAVDQAKAKVQEIAPVAKKAGDETAQAMNATATPAMAAFGFESTKTASELGVVGDSARQAGEKADQAFGGSLNKLKGMERQAMAVVAALLAAERALEAASEYYATVVSPSGGKEAGEEFLKSIQGHKAAQQVREIGAELEKLNNDIDVTQRSWFNDNWLLGTKGVQIAGHNLQQMRDKADSLRRQMTAKGIEDVNAKAQLEIQREGEVANFDVAVKLKAIKEQREADAEMYDAFYSQAMLLAKLEEEERQKDRKHTEDMQKAAERLNTTRVQGILDLQKAVESLFDAQSRGFTSGDGASGNTAAFGAEIAANAWRFGSGV